MNARGWADALRLVLVPISVGYAAAYLLLSLSSCGVLHAFDEVNNPSDDVTLSRCRGEGRAAKADGAAPQDAYAAYEACKKDGGL